MISTFCSKGSVGSVGSVGSTGSVGSVGKVPIEPIRIGLLRSSCRTPLASAISVTAAVTVTVGVNRMSSASDADGSKRIKRTKTFFIRFNLSCGPKNCTDHRQDHHDDGRHWWYPPLAISRAPGQVAECHVSDEDENCRKHLRCLNVRSFFFGRRVSKCCDLRRCLPRISHALAEDERDDRRQDQSHRLCVQVQADLSGRCNNHTGDGNDEFLRHEHFVERLEHPIFLSTPWQVVGNKDRTSQRQSATSDTRD